MYLTADTLKIDTDEGEFVLECETCDGERFTIGIHGIDLDAFYDQVKARIGSYLRERDEAQRVYVGIPGPVADAYDLSDPKHPDFHSVHADIWDMRDGK
jgi:hypothetical protein